MRRNRLAHSLAVILIITAGLLAGLVAPAAATLTVTSTPCTTSVTVTTTTETVLCTLSGLSASNGQVIRLIATSQFTSGTSTTALTFRIRRGTGITGTVVGPAAALTTTATNVVQVTHVVEDSPGEVSGQQYVLTVQQTAAAANGSGTFAEIVAIVF
jgi:hypothetical protein